MNNSKSINRCCDECFCGKISHICDIETDRPCVRRCLDVQCPCHTQEAKEIRKLAEELFEKYKKTFDALAKEEKLGWEERFHHWLSPRQNTQIKLFISQQITLTKQSLLKEVIKEIERMKKLETEAFQDEIDGYNQALSDLTSILESKL